MLAAIIEAAAERAVVTAPALYAGDWVAEGPWSQRTGPYLRRVVSRVPQASPADVGRCTGYALQAARAVSALSPAARAAILQRAAAAAARHRDDLAVLLALELGKPVKDGRGEIDRVADTLAVCAAQARQLGGELLPAAGWARGAGNTALTYRAPAGVALAITPFNAPANLLAHKLGASFAAGNTTIVKSPPQAPASTAAVVALLREAGMPAEAVQLLHGDGAVGAALCAADEVAVISFTGSAATGDAVARAAGAKRLVLELGGNAATIVCEDADIAAAARTCARTGYSNSGQSCISVQRVYVQRTRFEEFLDAFTSQVAELRTGDPLDPATDVGSMVDDEAAERVVRWAGEAQEEGAKITLGGTRDGATAAPTIVAHPPATANVVTQEVFGALVAVLPYDTFGEVIATCNASRYGLQAGLFTADITRIVTAWRELEVGGLVVNGSSNFRLDHVPFGGVKDSGFGRESPRWMIEDYTVVKTLLLRGLSVFGTSTGARRMSTAAAALTAQLESYGVEYIFGTCGHTNIALLDALSRSRIRFVIARHEQAAAHAADGYARASGKAGVLLVHVGPGMMNAVTGVATAAMDSVPLVTIAGDTPSYFDGRHPHQEVNLHADADQASIYRPFVKRAWRVHRPEDLLRFAERAFWTATSGRPGAVLLNVPMDIFSRPAPERPYPLPRDAERPALPPDLASLIAEQLGQAERPLIYIGGGLRDPDARTALLELAEQLDIPIAHSLMAKGTVPDSHPLLLGMTGFWGLGFTNDYARDADVVLALGTRFAETDASSWHPDYTWRFPPARLIQIDIDPAEIGRNYPVEIGAVADAGLAVTAISAAVTTARSARRRESLREKIRAARTEVFASAREQGRSEAFPLRPQRILADLRDALPADAVIVTDVGWNKNGFAQCYELPATGRFITPGGASTMGFGPAAAVGVQIHHPERPVVALIGDGGISAQLPAIPMAVEQGLPVLFVVMNNRAHGTIADLQAASFGGSYGCEFAGPDGQPYSPDFAALGRACGADGYQITSATELGPALRAALSARRTAVLDVPMVNEPVPTPGHWNITDIYRGEFHDLRH